MLPLHPASNDLPAGSVYRAVWRWHFYAGLVVAPFVVFLAITGAIYLWKPQYEAWRYRTLFGVAPAATSVTLEDQLAAARAAAPAGLRAQSFQPAFRPGESSQVVFRRAGASMHSPAHLVFVNPHTGEVLGELDESATFMAQVKKLHGTLFAGSVGEYVVELIASWALVLFLTGLYLAWPRPQFSVWGFLLPRLRAEGRVFWRDVHAVPAVWAATATIFLLVTGLLWTQGAGAWYRKISSSIGQGTPRESFAGAHHSTLTGWSPPLRAGLAEQIDRLASAPPAPVADHPAGHGGPRPDAERLPLSADGPYAGAWPLDRVVAFARDRAVPPPFAIGLPASPQGVYSAISDARQPFRRVFIHVDQYSGAVLADVRFKDFGYLAQFFAWGIVAHEGRLFGLANQILGTLATASVALLGVSGLAMWWQRRPGRRLAAPRSSAAFPRLLLAGTLVLAALLPLLAASLAVVWILDRCVAPRIPLPDTHPA